MKLSTLFLLTIASTLAACGGGGGGSSSGGGSATLPPTPVTTATPTPTLQGKVVQLAGPLAANGTPTTSSTPSAGAGIGGATVYVTTVANVATSAIPTTPVATATTAPDGSFNVAVPTAGAQYGLVVVNGTTIGTNGVTNLGFTLAHAVVTQDSTTATLYLDTLAANEQSGFTTYNALRTTANMPVTAADTTLQMVARLEIANSEAASCHSNSSPYNEYQGFGGVIRAGLGVGGIEPTTPFENTWATEATAAQQANLDFAGFAGPVNGPACPNLGGPNPNLPQNYFVELLAFG